MSLEKSGIRNDNTMILYPSTDKAQNFCSIKLLCASKA